jgi:hypothetical protein
MRIDLWMICLLMMKIFFHQTFSAVMSDTLEQQAMRKWPMKDFCIFCGKLELKQE